MQTVIVKGNEIPKKWKQNINPEKEYQIIIQPKQKKIQSIYENLNLNPEDKDFLDFSLKNAMKGLDNDVNYTLKDSIGIW